MIMPSQKQGLSQKIKRVENVEFVGREFHIDRFRRNLTLDPNDHAYRNIINIYGQGGVGKTWLVRKYEQIAREAGAVTAVIDTGVEDVSQAMDAIARQFEQQSCPLKSFSQRYRTYRQKMQEVESDPDAPSGLASLTRTAAKVGLTAARFGVAAGGGGPLFAAADEFGLTERAEEAIVAGVDALTSFLRRKLRGDDVNLLIDPIGTMTPLFARDLMELPSRRAPVVFFDTYERTAVFLDRWLRDLFRATYGDIPIDTILVIAGRYELGRGPQSDPAEAGPHPWSDFYPSIERISLEPFSDKEAREYLRRRGITNGQVVEVILRLSGHLPLLLNTLANETPNDPDSVGDPTGTAIERFLQWIDDPVRRQAALAGALPRTLNQDILALLMDGRQATVVFEWLRQQPFVEDLPAGGWTYSRLVRELMLRHQRQLSPQRWSEVHLKLADYYDARRADLGVDDSHGHLDDEWQAFTLNGLYHRLCAVPQRNLPDVLRGFVSAVDRQLRYARRWAETIADAGTDAGHAATREWGEKLGVVLRASIAEEYERACSALTDLMATVELEPDLRARALDWRGYLRQRARQYHEALQDLTQAIELRADKAEYWIDRAVTYSHLKAYDKVIEDCTEALTREPDSARALALRGSAYLVRGEYDAALTDVSRAVDLVPANASHYFIRGETYVRLDWLEEALRDYGRALELGLEPPAEVHRALSRAYLAMRRYPEALAEADRIIELEPDDPSSSALKGAIYQRMGDPSRAAAAFAEIIPRMTMFVSRWREQIQGVPSDTLRREMAAWSIRIGLSPNDAERVAKLMTRALEADPETQSKIIEADVLAVEAAAHLDGGRLDEALEIATRVLDLNEDPGHWLLRGVVLLRQGKLDEAQADLDRAIELDDTFARAFGARGLVRQIKGQPQEALADFTRALEYIPDEGSILLARGQVYMGLERYHEALADFTRMVDLGIEPRAHALSYRAVVLTLLDRLDEALADVNQAIELDPENQFIRGTRLSVYRAMGDFDKLAEGLADADEWAAAFVQQYHSRVAEGRRDLARLGVGQAVTNTGLPPHVMLATYNELIKSLEADPDTATRRLQAEGAALNAIECAALSHLEPALRSMNRAVVLVPDHAGYLLTRAEIHERMRNYAEALADLAKAIALAPDNLDALKRRGVLLRGQERYDKAMSDFNRVIALAPEDAVAVAQRGETYRVQTQYEDALRDFTRAIELRPDYQFALSSRAETYYALGRYDEALEDFNRVIKANPEYIWALTKRGHTYQAMDRHEEAVADYNEAIRLQPLHMEAIGARGQSLQYLWRLDGALEDLNRLVDFDPEAPWALTERGIVYFMQGRYDEALADLNKALQKEPDNEAALLTRGQTYRTLHRHQEALTDLDKLIERRPEVDWAWYQRSLVFREQGDGDRARNDLAQASRIAAQDLERQPANRVIMMRLALYHLASGDAQTAGQHYQKALESGVRRENILEAIYDLDELLALMPDSKQARAMRDRLSSHTSEG
jgi:tetratricopeptide (TPR) repeat protein